MPKEYTGWDNWLKEQKEARISDLEKAILFVNKRLYITEDDIKDVKEKLKYNQIRLPPDHGPKRFFPSVFYEDDYRTAEEKQAEWKKMTPEQKEKFEFIKYTDPDKWNGKDGYFTWEEGMNEARKVGLKWDYENKKFVDI